MNDGYRRAVEEAMHAVEGIASDDPVRPVAFQEILRAALTARSAGESPAGEDIRRGAEQTGDGPANRLASRLSVGVEAVERVFDFAGGVVSLTVQSNQLPSSKSGGTAQIALLLCAAYQGGLGEGETSVDVIRQVATGFGRYDEPNFASALRGLTGLLILGGTSRARTCRLTRPGYEHVGEIVSAMVPEQVRDARRSAQ